MKYENILDINEFLRNNTDKLVILSHNQEDLYKHKHLFFELVYITDGTAVHEFNDNNSVLKKGDYFIMDYGSPHGYSKSNDLSIINCLFLPEIIDDTLKDCRSFEILMQRCLLRYYKYHSGQTLSNRIFHDDDSTILNLMIKIHREYMESQIGYTEMFRLHLMEIIIHTMRKMVGTEEVSQSSFSINIIKFMNNNYKLRQPIKMFCKEHHFSLQYVSRKFKQETGMTITYYLQKVRIERSCELLTGSDMSVAEIAYEVGYEDVKFFNQLFRRFIRMTPREYKVINNR